LIVLSRLVRNILVAFEIRIGIPLSYTLVPHGSFDWFYLPVNSYLLLGASALLASFSLIVVGKRISKTSGSLTLELFSYSLLYGLVAPLWLIRATGDVVSGKCRNWRY